MSKENDYSDLDDAWENDGEDDAPDSDRLLDSIKGHKDARRRLDDRLEERRLREQMVEDF